MVSLKTSEELSIGIQDHIGFCIQFQVSRWWIFWGFWICHSLNFMLCFIVIGNSIIINSVAFIPCLGLVQYDIDISIVQYLWLFILHHEGSFNHAPSHSSNSPPFTNLISGVCCRLFSSCGLIFCLWAFQYMAAGSVMRSPNKPHTCGHLAESQSIELFPLYIYARRFCLCRGICFYTTSISTSTVLKQNYFIFTLWILLSRK